MKKILPSKTSGRGAAALASGLKKLVAADPEIAALGGKIMVREAWALSDDRVKVRVEIERLDGGYLSLTRVVPFSLPPGLKLSYRDWMIVIEPTWSGFRYRLLDESGDTAGESSEDLGPIEHAKENARREVDR